MMIDHTATRVPTADMHIHLEAAISPEMVVDLAQRYGVALPAGFGPQGFTWRDLTTFIQEYDFLCQVIRTADDYAAVAYDYLARAAGAGCVYVDFILSPAHGWMNGIDYDALVDAVGAALDRARTDHGILSSLSLTAVRAPGPWFGPDNARRIVAEAVAHPHRLVRGFGIAGDTGFDDLASYAPAFRAAKAAGLVTRAHCGEGEGVRGVATAIDLLEVDILDHATDGLADPAMAARLVAEQRLVTICPMAHVFVGVAPSLELHPGWPAIRSGLRACFGTDDPVFFRIDIAETYRQVAANIGADTATLTAFTRNALTGGLLPPDDAAAALARMDARA